MSPLLALVLAGCGVALDTGRTAEDDTAAPTTPSTTDTHDTVDTYDTADTGISDLDKYDRDGDGYVSVGTPDDIKETSEYEEYDCDDTDGDVNPGAIEDDETCGDGIDQDCDGVDAVCGLESGDLGDVAVAKFEGEGALDGAGSTVVGIGDVDGDGLGDVVVGAHASGDTDKGAAYLISTVSSSVTGILEASVTKFIGESDHDYFGISASGQGDVDGKGGVDLVIGASNESSVTTNNGAAYVFTSIPAGEVSASQAYAQLLGDQAEEGAGYAVYSEKDFDGDGNADVVVGSIGRDSNAGAVFVSYEVAPGVSYLRDSDVVLSPTGIGHQEFGSALAAGDLNGDGFSELVVSAPTAGVLYVYEGSDNGLSTRPALIIEQDGSSTLGSKNGLAVADVDGDGLDDILVGDIGYNDFAGRAVVISGSKLAGFNWNGPVVSLDAVSIFSAEGDVEQKMGSSVTAVDLDADDQEDFVYGASGELSGMYNGSVYVSFGPVESVNMEFEGERLGDAAGKSLAGLGDVNGDGIDDLAVGAFDDDTIGPGSGAAYVLLGSGL